MNRETSTAFDSYLGGEQKLPSSINIQEFCKNRIEEILMLTEALKESPFRGQAFQRLPKHMRRRQMSHYIKRLPRKLRHFSVSSFKDEGSSVLSKCPSRNYRRRPKNLLLEYIRRQRKNIWLETHIWHARRFHMTSKWGYRLPEKPSNKNFRACYRAAMQHCFLSDVSFYSCIELHGSESSLLEGLQLCVSPNCGLTFAAKMFKNGSREGSLTLYHPKSYPYKVVGEISFLWKPTEELDTKRKIWIFTHPLLYNEVSDIFKNLFSLCEVKEIIPLGEVSSMDIDETNKNIDKSNEKMNRNMKVSDDIKENSKSETMHIPFQYIPKFSNKDGSVTMYLLKDTLNRFKLTGPLSLAVISKAFSFDLSLPAPPGDRDVTTVRSIIKLGKRSYTDIFECDSPSQAKKVKQEVSHCHTGEGKSVESESTGIWWHKFYSDEFHKKCLEIQKTFFLRLAQVVSPTDLPPNMVLSVVIKDPRLTLPCKRTKSVPDIQVGKQPASLTFVDPSLCYSPLWDPEIRDEVCKKKVTTFEINRSRSNFIVPGADLENVLDDGKQARIPLLIIQRTSVRATDCSSQQNGLGSGFDIIVPPGWAMPVWLSLIYRGARTGGLRENESLLLESKNLCDYFQPDSAAGEIENKEKYRRLRNNYFKMPPNKRPNYIKLGVVSPFYFPWKAVIKDWKLRCLTQTDSEVSFFVLRDREKLMELNILLENFVKMFRTKKMCNFVHSFKEEMDCLVPVSVESANRGTPREYAMLCLPTREDIQEFVTNKTCPVEEPHVDANEGIRKLARLEHSKLLKSLKRKRKKDKSKREGKIRKKSLLEETSNETYNQNKTTSSEISENYVKKMESLWLQEPEGINSVIDSCSRTLIGYIVLGGFRFSQAHGLGLGYVTLRGLLYWLETCYKETINPLVLFRNTHGANYRFGKLTILTR